MPHHRVPRDAQDQVIADIEAKGEVIVQVLNIPFSNDVGIYTKWGHPDLRVDAVETWGRYAPTETRPHIGPAVIRRGGAA